MELRFWGVRGSVPVSGEAFAGTGGNTSCVEVRAEGARLVLDAGTGLRALGASLGVAATELTLCMSHVHWDHIQGVPFFLPFFHPGTRVRVLGARWNGEGVRDALVAQMRPPRFPVTLDALRARLEFEDVEPGAALEVGPFRLRTCDVPHPDGAVAWRVEAGGRAVVYATDVEHAGAYQASFLRLCEGADVLVHDAQYTAAEYVTRRGWGHSTIDAAAEVAELAQVGRLALFHHDPMREDAAVAAMEAEARARCPRAFAAREGQALAW